MITVTIAINDRVIYARTARNVGHSPTAEAPDRHIYDTDDGERIYHKRSAGVVALVRMMLASLRDVGRRQ